MAIACLPMHHSGIKFTFGSRFTRTVSQQQYYSGTLCTGHMIIQAEQPDGSTREFHLIYTVKGDSDDSWDEGTCFIWTEPHRTDEQEFFCYRHEGTVHAYAGTAAAVRRRRSRLARLVVTLLKELGSEPEIIGKRLELMEYQPNYGGLIAYISAMFNLEAVHIVTDSLSELDGIQIRGQSPNNPEIKLKIYPPASIARFIAAGRNHGATV
jgi:hypothetical protein